jgi:eukaryotic-like serine/threonine-protein kinase
MPSSQPLIPTNPIVSGTIIGDYQIGLPLGTGGMADVYFAIDQRLDRPVALKILRSNLAADETYRQRFLQEAKAAASLVHPNIVQIYSVGEDGQLRYIAQEYIPGTNLRQYLSIPASASKAADASRSQDDSVVDRQLPIQETLSILMQVLAALSKAAASGIVHRDIKPENIMLTPDGEAKVADFGLARITMGDDPRLTSTGTTLGTPMYMSPEQLEGGLVDIRSDLYSLGVTLFHMLYGRPPFTGETPLALAMQHVKTNVPETNSLRKSVPPSLEALVRRLLAKSPDSRFGNPGEVLEYLQLHRRGDLSEYWPDRIVPMPNVALAVGLPMQATKQLQALLRDRPKRNRFRKVGWSLMVVVWFGLLGWLGWFSTKPKPPRPDQLFAVTEDLFKNIPKRSSAKQQYEWALVDARLSRIAKWESVEHYFPRSTSAINRLYAGLAGLQLARAFKDVGDLESAARQLQGVIGDAQMPSLVQAHGWLQLAAVEHSRDNKKAVQGAVERAMQLSDGLSKADREQLDRLVRTMPRDIELYWTPHSVTQTDP